MIALGTLVAAAPAGAQLRPPPTRIAHDGFGDRRNSYAWSMAWFKGRLYVGTARDALCVERATIAYYWPLSGLYERHPAPGVSCPARLGGAGQRAEIWRYDPGTGRWARVYRSPMIRGRRLARDIGYRGMVVARDAAGRRALYVGAFTADEFIPAIARRHPPRLLQTTDGRHFRALRSRPFVIRTPFGLHRPVGFRSMVVHDGRLFVTVSGGITGDGVVMEARRSRGGAVRFEQVSPPAMAVFELTDFAGHLYAGTGDTATGYGVWRADGRRATTWSPVVTGGAGRGAVMTSVVSMTPYRGRLYVGASGWLSQVLPSSELIRVAPGGTWDVVAGAARTTSDGVQRAPLSGLGDGFGNPFSSHFWRMQVYRGALLLGTNDWSGSVVGNATVEQLLRPEVGFDLYATCDGARWTRETRDAFGHPDDFGLRTMSATPAGLFIGSTDHVRGTAVYRWRGAPCEARARVAAVGPAPRLQRAARLLRAHPKTGSTPASEIERLMRGEP